MSGPAPRLLSFSGLDGSGKTTLSEAVADALRSAGVDAVSTRPDYHGIGAVRAYCEQRFGNRYAYDTELDPDFYLSTLAADWLVWIHETLHGDPPAAVICLDRYAPDLIAQAHRHRARVEPIRDLVSSFPPATSFLLDIAPTVAAGRLERRSDSPRNDVEHDAALVAMVEGFAIAERSWPLQRLEAERTVNELVDAVMATVQPLDFELAVK